MSKLSAISETKALQAARQKRNDMVKSQNKEIESIKEKFNKQVKALQKEHEQQITNVRNRNHMDVVQAYRDKEEKLQKASIDLSETKKALADLKKNFEFQNEQQMVQKQALFEKTFEEKNSSNVARLQDLNTDAEDMIADARFNIQNRLVDINTDHHLKIKNLTHGNTDAITDLTDRYAQRMNSTKLANEQKLFNQAKDYKRKNEDMQNTHNKMMKLTKDRNLDEFTREVEMHKQSISGEKKDFDRKYGALLKTHKEMLENLEQLAQERVKSLKSSFSKVQGSISDKAQDDFYRVKTLAPTISSNEKSYTISLQIPDHEKDNVQISTKNRDVKLTLTRRFSDNVEHQDGAKSESQKFETLTKKFTVADILSPTKIVKTYDGGTLRFTIDKL